jgi:hypothetical protein
VGRGLLSHKLPPMVAGMASFEGAPTAAVPDAAREVRRDLVPWLREYDGFLGVLVLAGEGRHRVITVWSTPEDESSSRPARLAMHGTVAAAVGMSFVGYEVYEAPVYEVVP